MSGIVYKIKCNITNDTYYGSTKNLSHRLSVHKCRTPKQLAKRKCLSFDIINRGDWSCEIVEKVDDLDQLKIRERYYTDNFECINKQRPYTTDEEKLEQKRIRSKTVKAAEEKAAYYLKHKERLNVAFRKYHELNKDKQNALKAEKIICECGVTHTRGHKAGHLKSLRHLNNINK